MSSISRAPSATAVMLTAYRCVRRCSVTDITIPVLSGYQRAEFHFWPFSPTCSAHISPRNITSEPAPSSTDIKRLPSAHNFHWVLSILSARSRRPVALLGNTPSISRIYSPPLLGPYVPHPAIISSKRQSPSITFSISLTNLA